jgi:hypothetical protein
MMPIVMMMIMMMGHECKWGTVCGGGGREKGKGKDIEG